MYTWPTYLVVPPKPPKLVYLDLNHWIALAKVSEGGSESVEYTQDVTVSNPNNDLLANKFKLSSLAHGKGKFVMRYFRDTTLLAEGTFTLT